MARSFSSATQWAKHIHRQSKEIALEAGRAVISELVEQGKKEQLASVRKTFTLRNSWIENSLRSNPPRQRRIETLAGYVGTISPYLSKQEEGGVMRAKDGKNIAIPTSAATGEGVGKTGMRQKKVQSRFNLANIIAEGKHDPRNPSKSKPEKQRLVVTLKLRTSRFIYWEPNPAVKGLFLVKGGSERKRHRKGQALRAFVITMIRNLSQTEAKIPPHLFEKPVGPRAVEAARPKVKALLAATWKRYG